MTLPGPVLVLLAHPDDEVLGCGGTIASLADSGREVTVAILTDGVGSRSNQSSTAADERWAACEQANHLLGVRTLRRWAEGADREVCDNEADAMPRLVLARWACEMVAQYRPATVLTHSGADLNIDHRRVHEAALVACRPTPSQPVRLLMCCEIPSSTEWGLRPFAPVAFHDITRTLTRKVSAMECYRTEQPDEIHPRSSASLKALARWRGASAGVDFAEAFEIVRCLL